MTLKLLHFWQVNIILYFTPRTNMEKLKSFIVIIIFILYFIENV